MPFDAFDANGKPMRPSIDVTGFGARGDGTTDDLAAFVAALTQADATGKSVFVPATSAGYRLSAGITVPNQVTLFSEPSGMASLASGSILWFDHGVTTCVTIDGGAGNGSPGLRDISVQRA